VPRRSGRASAGIGHGPPRWSARIGGVDASIAVQWFANEPGSERAARLIVEERPALLSRAARLALEVDHPVYDCLYLVLASEQGARLATDDEGLRRVAPHANVRVWAR